MNRIIKFRGLRVDGKGWVYGVPFYNHEERVCFIIDNMQTLNFTTEDTKFNGYTVVPESVGQFTGLTDANGNEIYEGDIVTNGKFIYQVEYCVQNSHFRITPIDRIEGEFDSLIDTIEWGQIGNGYYSRKDLTITGNIHENN